MESSSFRAAIATELVAWSCSSSVIFISISSLFCVCALSTPSILHRVSFAAVAFAANSSLIAETPLLLVEQSSCSELRISFTSAMCAETLRSSVPRKSSRESSWAPMRALNDPSAASCTAFAAETPALLTRNPDSTCVCNADTLADASLHICVLSCAVTVACATLASRRASKPAIRVACSPAQAVNSDWSTMPSPSASMRARSSCCFVTDCSAWLDSCCSSASIRVRNSAPQLDSPETKRPSSAASGIAASFSSTSPHCPPTLVTSVSISASAVAALSHSVSMRRVVCAADSFTGTSSARSPLTSACIASCFRAMPFSCVACCRESAAILGLSAATVAARAETSRRSAAISSRESCCSSCSRSADVCARVADCLAAAHSARRALRSASRRWCSLNVWVCTPASSVCTSPTSARVSCIACWWSCSSPAIRASSSRAARGFALDGVERRPPLGDDAAPLAPPFAPPERRPGDAPRFIGCARPVCV